MNRKSWLGSNMRPSNAQALHPARDAQSLKLHNQFCHTPELKRLRRLKNCSPLPYLSLAE